MGQEKETRDTHFENWDLEGVSSHRSTDYLYKNIATSCKSENRVLRILDEKLVRMQENEKYP